MRTGETELQCGRKKKQKMEMKRKRKQQTCISNIDNTLAAKKRQNNNRRKTKSLHYPQLDHHDADGLAGHKAWRTAQTITRIF
jgi:hypothetical protein